MKIKLIAVLLLSSLVFSLGIMLFSSSGSINPKEIGFYASLGGGAIWFGVMYFLLRKNFK